MEKQIMAFSKLYGLESEIKINRKITKTGSVGRREPENLFGVALHTHTHTHDHTHGHTHTHFPFIPITYTPIHNPVGPVGREYHSILRKSKSRTSDEGGRCKLSDYPGETGV